MNDRFAELDKKFGYRGVAYTVWQRGENKWEWAYYPKIGVGVREHGELIGTHEEAISTCKKAIDAWLDDKNSNQDTTRN
jgi:hypothetical protein